VPGGRVIRGKTPKNLATRLTAPVTTVEVGLGDWGKILGDVPTATTILDRFLHHAEIITVTGKSYRLRHRGETPKPAKAPTGSKKNQKRSKPTRAPTGSSAEKEKENGPDKSKNQPKAGYPPKKNHWPVLKRPQVAGFEALGDSRIPIRYAGYSISYKPGGRKRDGSNDDKWHSHVEIDREQYLDLRAWFSERALRDSQDKLANAFYQLPIAPYAPVRRQMLMMLREVNRVRKVAGKKQLPSEILPLRRKVVKPFVVQNDGL